jgi:hypothetical protein
MLVCLYVCMELTQIHISEPIWIKPCTRLPLGLEETIRYVRTRNSLPLRHFGSFSFGGHCRIMGSRWLPARPFSAMPLFPWFQLVFVWRRRLRSHPRQLYIRDSSVSSSNVAEMTSSRRQSHPPQCRIPYSGGCSRHVADITFTRATGPSATALYPSF